MLKKILIGVGLILVLLVGLHQLSHQYRHELLDLAIASEAEKAGLQEKSGLLDGHTFSYYEGGNLSGPTLVLLHGFSATKENWLRFADYLTDDYRIIALDLAGHGKSAPELVPSFSVFEQARMVGRITEQLGIERFAIAGNSMGGAISSLVAFFFPDKVSHLVLISPAGVHTQPAELDERLKEGHNPLLATTPDEFNQVFDFVMTRPPFIPSVLKLAQGERVAERAELNKKIFAAIHAEKSLGLHDELAGVKVPTLILWGARDRAIHVDNLKSYVSLIPHAKTHVFDDVGHLAMIEVPEESALLTREFLQAKP